MDSDQELEKELDKFTELKGYGSYIYEGWGHRGTDWARSKAEVIGGAVVMINQGQWESVQSPRAMGTGSKVLSNSRSIEATQSSINR